MPPNSPQTLLPLDTWRRIVGLNPLHFWQVVSDAMPDTVCSDIWKQEAWQEAQMISREDVLNAIQEAERRIGDYLGYTLLPAWTADERQSLTPPAFAGTFNLFGLDVNGYRNTVQLNNGYYISGGIEAKTLIAAGASITYSDPDNDGYDELATVTVNTTVTDPGEIAVYFPGEDGANEWEVRPLERVTIAGGVATITFYRQLVPLPELWAAFAPTAINGDVDANFLEDVDVYRRWNDPQQQAQFLWSQLGAPCGNCGSCAACAQGTQWGCLAGRDYPSSIVQYQPGAWNADTGQFDQRAWAERRAPDRVRLWYYAGWRNEKARIPALQMDQAWARAVTYYSLTLLDRPICGCTNVEATVRHWRDELNLNESTQAANSSYQLGQRVLDNPFGAGRGALFAWDSANRVGMKLGRAARI